MMWYSSEVDKSSGMKWAGRMEVLKMKVSDCQQGLEVEVKLGHLELAETK